VIYVRAIVRFVSVLMMLIIVFLLVPGTVAANGYLEQISDNGKTFTLEDFEAWLANLLIGFIELMQRVSPLFIVVIILIGAVMLIIGGLVGNRYLRGAGISGIIAALFALIIIKNAAVIVLMIENLTLRQ
jgi:hypothetical protein